MKKVFIVILTGFFIITWIPAYTIGPYELFISTDPVKADVLINGVEVGETPLRLNNFSHDNIELQIIKEGFLDIEEELTLDEGRRVFLFYSLSPEHLEITFHQKEQDFYINNELAGQTPITIGNLPGGSYRLEKTDGGIAFSSERFSYLRRATLTESIFTAGLLGLSIAGSIIYRDQTGPETQAFGISSVFFGSLLGYNLLKLYKINTIYNKEVEDITSISIESFRKETARDLFSTGMELLGNESYDEALTKFSFVVNVFSDSEYSAISVYEMGYSYYMQENYEKALEYFRRFVYDYPIYELFNYGVYYLFEIALNNGQNEQVLIDYNNLRPVYIEDESGALHIEFYRILTGIFSETGEAHEYILLDLLDELNYFLDNMKDSVTYPEIYLRKGRLLYEYLDIDEGERILNDIKEKYSYDKNLMREVDIILNG